MQLLLDTDTPLVLAQAVEFIPFLLPAKPHGLHKRRTGEHVRGPDPPFLCDVLDGLEIHRHKALPQGGVLLTEWLCKSDVEAMVEKDELRLPRFARMRSDEDIPGMRVAMHPAPAEYLCAEELYHGVHYPLRPST